MEKITGGITAETNRVCPLKAAVYPLVQLLTDAVTRAEECAAGKSPLGTTFTMCSTACGWYITNKEGGYTGCALHAMAAGRMKLKDF